MCSFCVFFQAHVELLCALENTCRGVLCILEKTCRALVYIVNNCGRPLEQVSNSFNSHTRSCTVRLSSKMPDLALKDLEAALCKHDYPLPGSHKLNHPLGHLPPTPHIVPL